MQVNKRKIQQQKQNYNVFKEKNVSMPQKQYYKKENQTATTRRTCNKDIQLCTVGIWRDKTGKKKKEDWQQLLAQVPIFK